MSKENILKSFSDELFLQREALSTLFTNSTASENSAYFFSEMASGTDPFNDSYPGPPLWDTDWDDMKIMYHWQKWTRLNQVKIYSRDIYAASLFLVLNNWIQSLGVQLGINNQEERLNVGENIRNAKLSKLIWATANNFRHYNEWSSPTNQAQRSIVVLLDAGITPPMNIILAAKVLYVIGVKTYEELEKKIVVIGEGLKDKAP